MDTVFWIRDFIVLNWPWLMIGIAGATFQYFLDLKNNHQ
jgi:hypothetical protein